MYYTFQFKLIKRITWRLRRPRYHKGRIPSAGLCDTHGKEGDTPPHKVQRNDGHMGDVYGMAYHSGGDCKARNTFAYKYNGHISNRKAPGYHKFVISQTEKDVKKWENTYNTINARLAAFLTTPAVSATVFARFLTRWTGNSAIYITAIKTNRILR